MARRVRPTHGRWRARQQSHVAESIAAESVSLSPRRQSGLGASEAADGAVVVASTATSALAPRAIASSGAVSSAGDVAASLSSAAQQLDYHSVQHLV